MVNDPLADMLVQIKNAARVGKSSVSVPLSSLKLAVAEALLRAGYLGSVAKKGRRIKRTLELELLYDGKQSKVNDLKRVSKVSRRVYRGWRRIRPTRQGTGTAVYSTPRGVLTGKEARRAKVGGEALFEIW